MKKLKKNITTKILLSVTFGIGIGREPNKVLPFFKLFEGELEFVKNDSLVVCSDKSGKDQKAQISSDVLWYLNDLDGQTKVYGASMVISNNQREDEIVHELIKSGWSKDEKSNSTE